MLRLTPLHPIFLHFPIALLPVACLFDLFGRLTGQRSLTHAACWSLLAATAISPFASITGWLWLRDMGEAPYFEMPFHQWIGTAIPFALVPLAVWRFNIHSKDKLPSWIFLSLLMVMVGVITLQGHLGGLMTFSDEASRNRSDETTSPTTTRNTIETTKPTTQTDEDGWSDSINVEGYRHE